MQCSFVHRNDTQIHFLWSWSYFSGGQYKLMAVYQNGTVLLYIWIYNVIKTTSYDKASFIPLAVNYFFLFASNILGSICPLIFKNSSPWSQVKAIVFSSIQYIVTVYRQLVIHYCTVGLLYAWGIAWTYQNIGQDDIASNWTVSKICGK